MSGHVSVVIDGLRKTWDVAIDKTGNLFVAENNSGARGVSLDWRLLRVTQDGKMTILSGKEYIPMVEADPGPESFPMMSIAIEPVTQDLFVFIGSRKDRIYRISQEGTITDLPIEFERDIFNCDLAFDGDGNLFAVVAYSENYNVGPLLRRLFRVDISGELTQLANLDADLPNNEEDLALLPSGDIVMITRGVAGSPDEYELVKISPMGEKSRIAWHLPIDPLSMAMNVDGDIFFDCAMGIFKVSHR